MTVLRRFQNRRGTAARLAVVNEVLRAGEKCLETDTRREKNGDGVTAYNALPYCGTSAGDILDMTIALGLPLDGGDAMDTFLALLIDGGGAADAVTGSIDGGSF